jgi:hypothetical protein
MAKKPSSKPSSKTPAANAPAALSPELQQAKLNLQRQVGTTGNGISQAQADAEFARLQAAPTNDVIRGNLAAAAQQSGQFGPNAPGSPQSVPFGAANGSAPFAGEAPGKTPTDIANSQDLLNQQNISRQQALNRPGELNPFGGSNYVQNPDGTVTRVSTVGNLNPLDTAGWTGEQYQNQSYIDRALQAIAGEGGANNQGQGGLLPQLRGMFSNPLDYSKFSPVPTSDSFSADRQRVEGSLYDRYATVNEPLFQRQQDQLKQQLADQGIDPSNRKYQVQLDQLSRQQNDARQSAQTQAIGAGGQEQQRLFENAGTTRNQQIGEAGQLRAQPLTDLKGLLGAVNPVNLPQFNATQNINVPVTDFAGAADNQLTRNANLESAKLGFANQMAIAGLQAGAAKDLSAANNQQDFQNQQALNQQQFGFNQQLANANKPNSSSVFGQIGGGFLQGLFGGLGNSAGSSLGGWFGGK